MKRLRVLSVTSEYFPLIKTGGLADVAGALPQALVPLKVEMRTLLPAYKMVLASLSQNGIEPQTLPLDEDLFGGPAQLLIHDDLILLDAAHLYQREGNPYMDPYGHDWADNHRRFAALCWVAHVLSLGRYAFALNGWRPDIVHGHDWQAGLTAAYLNFNAPTQKPPTVLTIHNLAFQGVFDPALMSELRLPGEHFTIDGLEYYGGLGFLKAGLVYSDAITTVSPTYAREIQTPDHGMGLDGLLRSRAHDLTGIVNGIDDTVWDPAHDPDLPEPFDQPAGKRPSRYVLQERMALKRLDDCPLFCVISRLTRQKGLDLLLEVLPLILDRGGQVAILGSGDADLEVGFQAAASAHPGRIGCYIGYDEALSHLVQAGADGIIIPSRFEPCGLTQLCALRYGTIPIVARVGGLADTVIDANPAALLDGVATGFQFLPVDTLGLGDAIDRFIAVFQDQSRFDSMRKRAMSRAVGWRRAAKEYRTLYMDLLKTRDLSAA